jgi:hypothetical protein
MLGGRDLAGEPTDLDAKALGLRVELRPVGENSGRRVEEPQQAARYAVVDVVPSLGGHHAALNSTVQLTPITGCPSPSTSAPQKVCNSPPQPRLKRPFLEPVVDTPQKRGFGSSVESLYFSAICRTFISGGTRIRTGDTMIFSHAAYVCGCC